MLLQMYKQTVKFLPIETEMWKYDIIYYIILCLYHRNIVL